MPTSKSRTECFRNPGARGSGVALANSNPCANMRHKHARQTKPVTPAGTTSEEIRQPKRRAKRTRPPVRPVGRSTRQSAAVQSRDVLSNRGAGGAGVPES